MTREQELLEFVTTALPYVESQEDAGYKSGVIRGLSVRMRKAIEAGDAECVACVNSRSAADCSCLADYLSKEASVAGSHAHGSVDGNATSATDATESLLQSVCELYRIVLNGMTADYEDMCDALKRARLAVKSAGGKDL